VLPSALGHLSHLFRDEVQWSKLQNLGNSSRRAIMFSNWPTTHQGAFQTLHAHTIEYSSEHLSFASRIQVESDYEKIIHTMGDIEL